MTETIIAINLFEVYFQIDLSGGDLCSTPGAGFDVLTFFFFFFRTLVS